MTHYQLTAEKYSDILIWGKHREMNFLESTPDSRNRKSTVLQQAHTLLTTASICQSLKDHRLEDLLYSERQCWQMQQEKATWGKQHQGVGIMQTKSRSAWPPRAVKDYCSARRLWLSCCFGKFSSWKPRIDSNAVSLHPQEWQGGAQQLVETQSKEPKQKPEYWALQSVTTVFYLARPDSFL